MNNLTLVKPSKTYLSQLTRFKADYQASGEHLHGSARLLEFEQVEDWLVYVASLEDPATLPAESTLSSTFLCLDQNSQQMVGIVNIRHHLDHDFLINYAGHIGYSILPSQRRKGYAKIQLGLALDICRQLGMTKALVTCADWNIASERTILAYPASYQDSRQEPDGDLMKRYWISID